MVNIHTDTETSTSSVSFCPRRTCSSQQTHIRQTWSQMSPSVNSSASTATTTINTQMNKNKENNHTVYNTPTPIHKHTRLSP
eukprot:m.27939 g.27939  ORF g.27939 m.27939 type:complete len:82 (+) comp9409_c0_seq6:676-921(+)